MKKRNNVLAIILSIILSLVLVIPLSASLDAHCCYPLPHVALDCEACCSGGEPLVHRVDIGELPIESVKNDAQLQFIIVLEQLLNECDNTILAVPYGYNLFDLLDIYEGEDGNIFTFHNGMQIEVTCDLEAIVFDCMDEHDEYFGILSNSRNIRTWCGGTYRTSSSTTRIFINMRTNLVFCPIIHNWHIYTSHLCEAHRLVTRRDCTRCGSVTTTHYVSGCGWTPWQRNT